MFVSMQYADEDVDTTSNIVKIYIRDSEYPSITICDGEVTVHSMDSHEDDDEVLNIRLLE